MCLEGQEFRWSLFFSWSQSLSLLFLSFTSGRAVDLIAEIYSQITFVPSLFASLSSLLSHASLSLFNVCMCLLLLSIWATGKDRDLEGISGFFSSSPVFPVDSLSVSCLGAVLVVSKYFVCVKDHPCDLNSIFGCVQFKSKGLKWIRKEEEERTHEWLFSLVFHSLFPSWIQETCLYKVYCILDQLWVYSMILSVKESVFFLFFFPLSFHKLRVSNSEQRKREMKRIRHHPFSFDEEEVTVFGVYFVFKLENHKQSSCFWNLMIFYTVFYLWFLAWCFFKFLWFREKSPMRLLFSPSSLPASLSNVLSIYFHTPYCVTIYTFVRRSL